MGNAMMKVLVMLLPWLMAKADAVIDYMLRRNRIGAFADTDEDGKRKRDGEI